MGDGGTTFGTSRDHHNSCGSNTNILIDNNLLAGGAAHALLQPTGVTGTNYGVTNNHFSTQFKSTVGYYWPLDDCADETQSGNVYYETGLPMHMG